MNRFNLLIILITSILFSCSSNEDENISEIFFLKDLKNDSRMLEYLNANQEVINKIKNINIVQELTSKENLNELELNQLSLALGFNSYNQHENYYRNQNDLLANLNSDYSLSNYSSSEIYEVLFDEDEDENEDENNLLANLNYSLSNYKSSEISEVLFNEDKNIAFRGVCEDSCDRTYRNCMGGTTAAAIAAHAGCIALDPTIIGGIVCHGAALAIQYFAQDECGNQNLSCHRDCNE